MATGKRATAPPQPKAATLDDFKEARTCWCELPSGLFVRLRPVNLTLHAMNGGMPDTLRRMTGLSPRQIGKQIAESPNEAEAITDARRYMDGIVRDMVIEPEIPKDLDLEETLLPADYLFLFQIAQGERDEDARGVRLWGREPISRWALFRDEHGCESDCEACLRVQDAVSAYGSG